MCSQYKKRCPGFVRDSCEICTLLGLSIFLFLGGMFCVFSLAGLRRRSENFMLFWIFLGW